MKPTARMSALAAALLTLLTALLIGIVNAGPASAHTALTSASPTADSTVRPPNQIVLTYNDPVRFTQVLIRDDGGRQYQSGRPVNVDNTVTEAISPSLPNGRYTVAWRVVAPDGHPVEGTYRFTVSGSTAASPTAAPAPAQGQGQPSDTTASSGTSVWWIVVIGVLIAAAAVGGVLLLRQSTSESESDPDEVETHADTEAGAGH